MNINKNSSCEHNKSVLCGLLEHKERGHAMPRILPVNSDMKLKQPSQKIREEIISETAGYHEDVLVDSCMDLPVGMKNAKAVFYNNFLYIGGGYTGDSKQDSIVYMHDHRANTWKPLPLAPLKWFTIAIFMDQMILIGGKEYASHRFAFTNKIAVWNKDTSTWAFSLPPMSFARCSPVVITSNDYLIIAGGNNGSLDYNMEIFDSTTQQWACSPYLPLPCLIHTSATIGNTWYLLDDTSGKVIAADIPTLISRTLQWAKTNDKITADSIAQMQTSLFSNWYQELSPPSLNKPFRIIAFGGNLISISHAIDTIIVHACDHVNSRMWIPICKLPHVCGSASVIVDDIEQRLLVLGGDSFSNKTQYSKKMFKVSFH